jgi:hypothetical protein
VVRKEAADLFVAKLRTPARSSQAHVLRGKSRGLAWEIVFRSFGSPICGNDERVSSATHLPTHRPTASGASAPGIIVQVPALHVGARSGPRDWPSNATAAGPPLDLRRFSPVPPPTAPAWSHRIRRLVGGYRLALPELDRITDVVSVLEPDRWVLRSRRRRDAGSALARDRRGRVVVPAGVRHCLGLGPWVVVSLRDGLDEVVVWSTSLLDAQLEVNP